MSKTSDKDSKDGSPELPSEVSKAKHEAPAPAAVPAKHPSTGVVKAAAIEDPRTVILTDKNQDNPTEHVIAGKDFGPTINVDGVVYHHVGDRIPGDGAWIYRPA